MLNHSILAISAHPDDVEFTTGGSLTRWIAEGWKVSLIVCTDGGKGTQNPAAKPSELAVLHRDEQLSAARLMGVTDVFFLDHPDGELTKSPKLVSELARHIRQVKSRRLVSWDPWRRYEFHPDHRVAGQAAVDAVLAAGNPHYFPEFLGEGLHAYSVPEVYLFGAEQPNAWVDITTTIEQKNSAIACHQSQMNRISTLMNDLRTCNAEYGTQGCFTFAEAFKVLHPFCDT